MSGANAAVALEAELEGAGYRGDVAGACEPEGEGGVLHRGATVLHTAVTRALPAGNEKAPLSRRISEST